MSKHRNFEIDRLRGWAIIMVLIAHIGDFLHLRGVEPSLMAFVGSGLGAGVDLFFVISGYVVSGTIVPRLAKLCRGGTHRLVGFSTFLEGFYARRCFRILPMSWVVLAVFLGVYALVDGSSERLQFGLRTALAAFGFVTNYFLFLHPPSAPWFSPFGPYWSLAIEEQFYFIYPLFLALVRGRRQRLTILAALMVVEVLLVRPVGLPLALHAGHSRALFATHLRCDGILAGCVLYFARGDGWPNILAGASKWFTRLFAALTTSALLVGMVWARAALQPQLALPVTVAMGVLLVALASFDQGLTWSLGPMGNRWINWFGSRSYSLYLINWPMLWLCSTLGLKMRLLWPSLTMWSEVGLSLSLWLAMTFALTELAFHCVERPLMNYGGSLGKKLEERARAATVAAPNESELTTART